LIGWIKIHAAECSCFVSVRYTAQILYLGATTLTEVFHYSYNRMKRSQFPRTMTWRHP